MPRPAATTSQERRDGAVCPRRPGTRRVGARQVPLAGSDMCAVLRLHVVPGVALVLESGAGMLGEAVPVLCPPAATALPLGSNVAVWSWRAVLRLPVAVQVPLAGSYSSALLREAKPIPCPAAT